MLWNITFRNVIISAHAASLLVVFNFKIVSLALQELSFLEILLPGVQDMKHCSAQCILFHSCWSLRKQLRNYCLFPGSGSLFRVDMSGNKWDLGAHQVCLKWQLRVLSSSMVCDVCRDDKSISSHHVGYEELALCSGAPVLTWVVLVKFYSFYFTHSWVLTISLNKWIYSQCVHYMKLLFCFLNKE